MAQVIDQIQERLTYALDIPIQDREYYRKVIIYAYIQYFTLGKWLKYINGIIVNS